MAQPKFHAQVAYRHDLVTVEEYTPSQVAGETLELGDFAVWDSGNSWMERAGADPTLILGLSEGRSEDWRLLTENGKVPIRRLSSDLTLQLSSATVPVEATHLNNEYGITRNATGQWEVDPAKTGGSARVKVIRLDVAHGIWFVQLLAEFIDDGVDS